MPYLDMTDPDNFTHLIQLFLAAHPHYQQENAKVRAHTGDPAGHYLSQEMLRALAAWGRERHLLRRKDAACLRELAGHSFRVPADVVTLTPRCLGTPPRVQPTVLSTEIFTWLYLADADLDPGDEVLVMTIPAALTVLDQTIQDTTEADVVRVRAWRLHSWLMDHADRA